MSDGWLDKPQEWKAIPKDDTPRRGFASPLKDRLDAIVKAGGAGRPWLLKQVPRSEVKRLRASASGYKRQYGKAGFTFSVRELPDTVGDSQVGLFTVWTPPQHASGPNSAQTMTLPPDTLNVPPPAPPPNLEPERAPDGTIVN